MGTKQLIGDKEEKAIWMAWVRREFRTSYDQIYKLITANAHLYVDNGMPVAFQAFIAHYIQYRDIIARWDEGDSKIIFSRVPYPDTRFAAHVEDAFEHLKAWQAALLLSKNKPEPIKPKPVEERLWDTGM